MGLPATRNAHRSLQWRLAAIAAAFVIPAAMLGVYLAAERTEDKLEELKAASLGFARVTAAQQAATLRHVRSHLATVAALLGNEAKNCEALLQRSLSLQSLVLQLVVADERGEIVCSARPLAAGAANVARRPIFDRARKAPGFHLSEAMYVEPLKQWLIVGAQPVLDESSQLEAVLMARLDLGWPSDLIERLPLPKGSNISLVDRAGRIIAYAPHAERFVGKAVLDAEQFALRVAGKAHAFTEGPGLDGLHRLVAYSRVPDNDLYVRVGVPKALADQARNEVLFGTLAVVALVLGAMLAAGWTLSRRLATGVGAQVDALTTHGERVTRALRTLSAGNRTLLREREEGSLLAAMCKVAVEEARYRVAFVNYAEQDERRSVRTVARAGEDAGFIDLLELTWADEERGRGSVGTAIRGGSTTVIRSMASDARFTPWREAAVARGLGSVASFPLRVDGAVVGTFTLIAAEEDAFDEGELELLDEMAADLSFGIETIRGAARRREAEAAASRALTHDALVDLPNRPTFIRMVMAALADARQGGAGVAVLALHIGRLQEIFDSFGYEPYRRVLQEIAARIATVPACHDASARLPMEEFGVLVPTKDLNVLGVIGARLLDAFKAPISIGEVKLDVRAAVGVSLFPEHGEDGESLIRRACLVAREAFTKDLSFQVCSGRSERENPERLALAAELREAIEGDRLHLNFQPKVRVADGARAGYEALVRWNHPARGAVAPMAFIPVAEQMGMIGSMTHNVVRMAVKQLHAWAAAGRPEPIAVNLSARNLHDPMLLTMVDRWLGSYGVPGERLEFEITESALVEDPQRAKRTLAELRARGAKIYIDDFGTGYSSLSYLAALPVTSLKIDRSFIRDMGTSRAAYSVVASIISMAHNLELGVVAEGVETAAQLESLRALGCDEAQGYLFGRPAPAEAL